jgi:hypothetical protein
MKNRELSREKDIVDTTIQTPLKFDVAQEDYHRGEAVDRSIPASEWLDILRSAVKHNTLKGVKVLIEEKGITPDTDILHYALENAELSAESSKWNMKSSIKILTYLMQKVRYMNAGLDSPQEELDLQEKQEDFMKALSQSPCTITDNIWNKDKQSIEFENTLLLEWEVIKAIKNCPKFIVDTNTSTLTLYEVVKNRLIASDYFEKYYEIVKAENRSGDGSLLYLLSDPCPSIQLTILQLSSFYIERKTYPVFLVNRISQEEIKNAKAVQALLGCRDENGQVMLGDKAQNKEWCISLYKAIHCGKVEDVASLLDINYTTVSFDSKAYKNYMDTITSPSYIPTPHEKAQLIIAICLKGKLSLEKTTFAEIDKKEDAGVLPKPDPTPLVSSFSQNKKSKLL